jgi:hypothetical protein
MAGGRGGQRPWLPCRCATGARPEVRACGNRCSAPSCAWPPAFRRRLTMVHPLLRLDPCSMSRFSLDPYKPRVVPGPSMPTTFGGVMQVKITDLRNQHLGRVSLDLQLHRPRKRADGQTSGASTHERTGIFCQLPSRKPLISLAWILGCTASLSISAGKICPLRDSALKSMGSPEGENPIPADIRGGPDYAAFAVRRLESRGADRSLSPLSLGLRPYPSADRAPDAGRPLLRNVSVGYEHEFRLGDVRARVRRGLIDLDQIREGV